MPLKTSLRIQLFLLANLSLAAPVFCATPGSHQFGNPTVVQKPPRRTYHVVNYKLTLHFKSARGEVFGKEIITLMPLHANFRRFHLDSSGLRIDSVSLETTRGRNVSLPHQLKDGHLWIRLNRAYGRNDRMNVRIVYHGIPRTGLFFVNPTANYLDQPREIWSQGEPELNHYWFPCWDYPNDMSTSEVVATVPNGQTVVSNGRLIGVTHHAGQVTFDWLEIVPHSSYLISVAVGPWKRVADHAGRLPVDYYVTDGVSASTVSRSFHLTPDMIEFFSSAFAVPYPYEKYDQVAVRNYFFGGMENVSATTLTDATLHGARAEPEYSSQGLVAHELGQHWFGDLVQGRDWADIWLNEGFATYLEALYTQHHDGDDAFRYEMWQNQLAAERQDQADYLRPIVDDNYLYPLQMFDSITHEKGAVVLDMLRYVLDGTREASQSASQKELFFRALHAYLTRYHAQATSTADLVHTLEAATGRELARFFTEWVFMAGSPHYVVTAQYNPSERIEVMTIAQTQQGEDVPQVFAMPLELAFYGAHGQSKQLQVIDDRRSQHFRIPLDFAPDWVDFDPEDVVEKTLDFPQPGTALIAKAENDPAMMSRLAAVRQLGEATGDKTAAVAALIHVLDGDPFYGVRVSAAEGLGQLHTASARAALLKALSQPDSRVRVAVVHALAKFRQDSPVYEALVHSLRDDPSYAVQAAAAATLGKSGVPRALRVLETAARGNPDIHVMRGIFAGLAATGNPEAEALLLAYAQAGVPEDLRLDALQAIAQVSRPMDAASRDELVNVVRSALHDPYLSVQLAGERLAGMDGLNEFREEIQFQAKAAPTALQKDAAHTALEQILHGYGKQR